MTDAPISPEEVLRFWFLEAVDPTGSIDDWNQVWFGGGEGFDEVIRSRFAHLPDSARRGELDAWRAEARSALALVLVLDQFPRNIFRGSGRCFAYDGLALDVARASVERGDDRTIEPIEAAFVYMPFEHAEDIEAQRRCVTMFEQLVDRVPADQKAAFEEYLSYAIRHHDVIERFGRFPHRNEQLGRTMTAEERNYLDSGGDTF